MGGTLTDAASNAAESKLTPMRALRRLAPLCALALLVVAPTLASERPPNVLLLLAGDQRADTIGALGNRYIATENLNRLVSRGFSFRNAYVFGSKDNDVSASSRSMLHTGRIWLRDGEQGLSLPERLTAAGYQTFIAGRWHGDEDSLRKSYQRGRAIQTGETTAHLGLAVRELSDGALSSPKSTQAFSSELFADAAIELLKGVDASRPFFGFVGFTAPRDPRQPPPRYRNFYYENLPPLPENFLPQHPFDNGQLRARDESLAGWPRSPSVIRQQLAEYYGMVTHLDEQVGRVLAALETSRHADDTLVIYASDHGLALGSHGLLGKQSLYEHSVKTPLIVSGLGIERGTSDALVYLHDLVPTILDVAGADDSEEVDGNSLLPLWTGEENRLRDSVFLPFGRDMRALRTRQHKLIVYPSIGHRQLFDLSIDPQEMRDLASTPENVDLVMRLTSKLLQWQERSGDTLPLEADELANPFVDLSGTERTPDSRQPKWIVKKYYDQQP
ncbi:MAG: sulfatase-like hydrolase/transferase [Acidobacteriota bacterium]